MRWWQGWDEIMLVYVSFTWLALATCCVAVIDLPHGGLDFAFHQLAIISAALLSGISAQSTRVRRRRLRAERTMEALSGLVPVSVDSMGTNEESGTRTLAITRKNGTVVTVELPAAYHPSQDGGRLLMETIMPGEELDKLLGIPTTVHVNMEADDAC